MNSRHAAALALVLWYLMEPSRGADINAISSKWKIVRTYNTAVDCEAVRADALRLLKQQAETNREDVNAQNALAQGSAASQCVAANDPRLKGR
jgi:hypothetical protein